MEKIILNKSWDKLIDYHKIINDNYEKEYDTDMSDNEQLDNNMLNYSLDNEKILNVINDILNITDLKKKTSLEILEQQKTIVVYINKIIIQNNNTDMKFIIKSLNWLKDTSEYLSQKIKVKLIHHNFKLISKNKIFRSSYKFCGYKNACNYNYKSKKQKCYSHHYVHNMIYADIESLIIYLDQFHSENNLFNKEVIKCINTISFVIKHMYEELNNLCIYADKKYHDKYHV